MDSINIKLNLRKVTKSIAKAVEELADPANYLRPAIFDVLDAFKQRIHVDGDRPGGSAIGTYTNPYLRYRINKFKRDSSTKMIFSLTRQMENDYTIAPTKNGYSIGFTNSFNFDKSQWLEEKKGEVFSLSQAEVDILYENIDFFYRSDIKRMIAEFVKLVDDELHGLVDQIKSFGLSVLRIDKEDGRRVPMVLSFDGKEINATISDVYKVSTYHRLISSTITLGDNESGYGHELNQSINNYNMALFVYFKRDKVKLYPDELSILFQSEMNFFKKVNIGDDFLGDLQASTQSASFEEETIWRQEYNTKFDLDPRDSLFQINYQFQLTTERKCIHKICKIC